MTKVITLIALSYFTFPRRLLNVSVQNYRASTLGLHKSSPNKDIVWSFPPLIRIFDDHHGSISHVHTAYPRSLEARQAHHVPPPSRISATQISHTRQIY